MNASDARPDPPACTKVCYRSKLWAERAVDEHFTEGGNCSACRSGGRFNAYHCTEGGHHWHVGHDWQGHRRRRPNKTRKPSPAVPHTYWATKIYTSEGMILRCHQTGCQDDTHANRAPLGFDR